MLYRYAVTMRIVRFAVVFTLVVCLAASASLLFAAKSTKDQPGPVTVKVNR